MYILPGYVTTWAGTYGSNNIFHKPMGIAVNRDSQDIYVADSMGIHAIAAGIVRVQSLTP